MAASRFNVSPSGSVTGTNVPHNIYTRVSTVVQERDGLSLRAQGGGPETPTRHSRPLTQPDDLTSGT
jgi:hypothetical protein